MVMLSEQERILTSEVNKINDITQYSVSTTTLSTMKDYGTINVPEDGLVIWKYRAKATIAIASRVYTRLKIGGLPVFSTRAEVNEIWVTYGGLCWLAAGNYNVTVEGGCTAGSVSIDSFQLGFVKFNDSVGQALVAYSSGIAKTVAARITCAGPLSQAMYCVQIGAYTPTAVTTLENVGDSFTNGVSVFVDNVQQNWAERVQDTDSLQTASGKMFLPFSVGASHTITISKDNADTVVNITICACPWILAAGVPGHTPITQNVSQGSTLYLTVEPLFLDSTKVVGVGKVRAVSYGTATDYYGSTTATGIIGFSFTYESADTSISCSAYGLGGCIGILGVDLR